MLVLLAAPGWSEPAPEPLGEQAESSLDARQKARQYSFDTSGIGILISYGTKNAVSAADIGNAFVAEIEKRGVKSRYFFHSTDRDGMGMEFYIGYSAMGPWSVDHAASQVSKAVSRAKAMQKVHSGEIDTSSRK